MSKVLLVGVGGDSTNVDPVPRVRDDGSFEYVPIPERSRKGTTESLTYGDSPTRLDDGVLSDVLDAVDPSGKGRCSVTGPQLRDWPLHHDPNFNALTYGESPNRPAYVKRLRRLEPGDLLAFYTGLKDGGKYTHRYVIGYFTVRDVVDFRDLDGGRFSELSREKRTDVMERHRENAHAKRFFAAGEITGDGLVIVDGREPGGLLNRAVRISKHSHSCHHYLRDDLQEKFDPESDGDPNRTAYLGGVKQAHVLGIPPEEFIRVVGSPSSVTRTRL